MNYAILNIMMEQGMTIDFRFNSNAKIVNQKMSNMVAKQMPFAQKLALNNTAKNLVARNKRDMSRIFDRPVKFTLNAFYFKPAKKYENSVTIKRKDMVVGKHYLEVQEEGGARPQTGFEKALSRNLAYSNILRHATPASVRRNKNGNMTPGARMQMLSALQVARDPQQRSKKFGRTNSGRQNFFIVDSADKSAGIYQRYKKGNVKKLVNFHSNAIIYKPKLRFDDRMVMYGKAVFPKKLQEAMRRAMATAKLR